ncbi:PREDICTED: androgen-induced gene 1 protein-like isoform X2 [Branchiostoma belcheri]|uniref:Androgen-induced gene 1 protein-like isoform X2 n=1 Tax=Branchiostoma belcheri TaxID=7741 RepID=A0A6P4ZFV2_BRABE|nr:PREDICTED: androgen-induced gene 1 protein-like isoform X2 [Branchiostoma belcheri]
MMASAKVVSHLAVFLLLFTANYNDFSRGYSSNLSFKSDGEGRKGASYAGRWKYLSILVSTVQCLFWAIYAIDRELVYPSKLDAIIPTWLNHVWHTTTVPVLLLEMYVVRRRYPARTAALPGTVFFGAAYLIWIRIVAHYGGFWVYPFLEVMGPIGTSVFNMAAVGMLCVFYMVGEYVNTKLWGRDAFEISSTTSRKKSNKSA